MVFLGGGAVSYERGTPGSGFPCTQPELSNMVPFDQSTVQFPLLMALTTQEHAAVLTLHTEH